MITEVVLVEKSFTKLEMKIHQADPMGILIEDGSTNVIHAEILAVDPKTVQMRVAPAEGNLERIMKITYCLVGANQKPAPDRRTDGAQPGMALINFTELHHAVHVIRSAADRRNL